MTTETMRLLIAILARTVALFVHALELLMLIRAILSWFPPSSGREGPFRAFVTTVTEFAIGPVRALLDRFEFTRRSPIDIPFLVTFLLLSMLSTFLPVL